MIIGILGKKRVGKDTAADYIVKRSNNFTKMSFAAPMKAAVRIIFDWSEEHVNGHLKDITDPRWGISPRQALQNLGTQWGQFVLCEQFPQFKEVVGRQIWVKRLLLEAKHTENVVISDVRFQHEVDTLTQHGAIIIKITRPSLDSVDEHESEKNIDFIPCNNIIVNEGTLDQYIEKVEQFWSAFFE